MGKFLKWVGYALGATAALAMVLWTISRLCGSTTEQADALATLRQPWNPPGSNAYPALWLLHYDVPAGEQVAVMAEDLRRMAAVPKPGANPQASGSQGLVLFSSIARERYPDLTPPPEDRGLLCNSRSADCLQRVREDLPRYEALVEKHGRLFERVAALGSHGHYRTLSPQRMDAPIPPFQLASAAMTAHAVAFVRGDVDTALGNTCRDIATWRRLGAHSDSLIMRMISIAYSSEGYGQLLAGMLAELPQGHPVPQACMAAVAPAAASELRLCEPLRGEFAYSSMVITTMVEQQLETQNPIERMLTPLFFDPERTKAEMATALAPACAEHELHRIEADIEHRDWAQSRGVWRPECAANIAGCLLADISRPAFTDYALRAQDHGMRLKTLATLLWLREQPDDGRPLETRLADRPESLKSPTREIEVGEDGRSLRTRQFDSRRGEYWEVPLPRGLRGKLQPP